MRDAGATLDGALIGAAPRGRPASAGTAVPGTPVVDTVVVSPATASALTVLWRRALLIFALAFTALLAIDIDTVLDLFDGWGRTGTYAHGYFIYPVSIWLIWRMRRQLAVVAPKAQPLALLPLVGCGFAWLVGHAAGVHAPAQYAFVAMTPCLVWAVFGNDVTRRILYPLAFLLFAVPAGDFLMPTLMDHTADFTVQALRLSGIPVFREGNYFQIPSGNWSVVEACSGIRYLIASVTLGFLFAYLNYRSAWRRLAFIVASLLVPIVANWLRAYLIVMIAHLSSNSLATGVDHIIYGWLFFGLVMMLLFWVGNFWRDDDVPESDATAWSTATLDAGMAQRRMRGIAIVAAVFVAVAAPWPAVGRYLEARADAVTPGALTVGTIDGWASGAPSFTSFAPHYLRSRASFSGTFSQGERQVGLFIAYYSGQLDNGLLVTYDNEVVTVADKVWGSVAERSRPVVNASGPATVVENLIKGEAGTGAQRVTTWRWYWVNGRLTNSKVLVKVYNAWDKLLGRGDDSAVIVLTTPSTTPGGSDAEQTLAAFAAAAQPSIAATLAATHDEARR